MATEQRNLIDRDELKLAIKVNGVVDIDDFPTVDAVEVVRCKDCEHSEPCICVVCEEGNTMVCRRFLSHVQKDHFCSYGERRTDA